MNHFWCRRLACPSSRDGRSTKARSFSLFLSTIIAAGGLVWGQTSVKAEDRSPATVAAQSSFSTSKSNNKLRWLPYKTDKEAEKEKVKSDPDVRAVQYTAPMANDNWTEQQRTPTPAVRPAPGKTTPPNTLPEAAEQRQPTLLPAPPADLDSSLAIPPAEPLSEPAIGANTLAPPSNYRAEKSAEPQAETPKSDDQGTPGWAPLNNRSGPNAPSFSDNNIPHTNPYLKKRNGEMQIHCLSVKDLKPITKISTDINKVQGEVPKNCPWGNEEKFAGRSWDSLTFTWTASALCHKPLYFEDEKLERYGHTWGPWLQPIISHARFFATIPVLPYKMGLETPNECMYALGYYRPGSCAPYYLDPIPLSVRAGLFEAGAVVGGIALIP